MPRMPAGHAYVVPACSQAGHPAEEEPFVEPRDTKTEQAPA
jgi:hypothetical protein